MNFTKAGLINTKITLFIIGYLFCVGLISCNKKTEPYESAQIKYYYPLEEGRYIIYKVDSLIYISFGTRDTIIHCQVKYQTEGQITDNLGRPSYRIFRYYRSDENQPWVSEATIMATNTVNSLELVEDNLRFIKLRLPIKENITWKGNSYIETSSVNSNLRYLDNWDYVFHQVGNTEIIGTDTLKNVITVDQRDEIIGLPQNADSYSEINYAQEKYALGIGMVYKTFLHKEYQPNNGGYVADGSYGVTYTMIEHN